MENIDYRGIASLLLFDDWMCVSAKLVLLLLLLVVVVLLVSVEDPV
jgi:hypothetical protein